MSAIEKSCARWCTVDSHEAAHDPTCWGPDQEVNLTLEHGYPVEALPDRVAEFGAPHVGAYPYRQEPGYREVVYLHVYRPHDNEHLDLDGSVHLTAEEAVRFAHALLAAADCINDAIGALK